MLLLYNRTDFISCDNVFYSYKKFISGGNRSSSYLIVLHIINTNLIL
jgi:predicted metal-dependent hydrolase